MLTHFVDFVLWHILEFSIQFQEERESQETMLRQRKILSRAYIYTLLRHIWELRVFISRNQYQKDFIENSKKWGNFFFFFLLFPRFSCWCLNSPQTVHWQKFNRQLWKKFAISSHWVVSLQIPPPSWIAIFLWLFWEWTLKNDNMEDLYSQNWWLSMIITIIFMEGTCNNAQRFTRHWHAFYGVKLKRFSLILNP